MRVASNARRIQGRGAVSISLTMLVMDLMHGLFQLDAPLAPTLTCAPAHPKMGP